MKHLRLTFEDQEFEELSKLKKLSGESWHDFVIEAAGALEEYLPRDPLSPKDEVRITKDLVEDSQFKI
jgi:hypothetical protein